MKGIKTNRRKKGINTASATGNMRCPYCGAPVRLRSADGIYRDNSRNVQLYVCSNYPACDSYVRVHPGTTIPVGSLANAKLRALRKTTHQHFDKLYESGLMTKEDAYNWLAFTLQSPLSQAHIGYQSEYYCNLIIDESKKLLEALSWKLNKTRRASTAYRPALTAGGVTYDAQ